MKEEPFFEIGLCMAGAVSAGAYTAGVMDYLIETLDKWEQARTNNDASVPTHKVRISILSGASAGGMTAIITAAALQNKLPAVNTAYRNDEAYKQQNKLYNTWVNLVADDMIPEMLSHADLKNGKKARSFLNSDFIDRLADEAIQCCHNDGTNRNYFASDLELLVSLSNIVGIPYELGFISNARVSSRYKTKAHGDYGHFILTNSAAEADAIIEKGRIPLSFIHNINIDIARDCAKATGAFPVGLAARQVSRNKLFVENNSILNKHYHSPNRKMSIPDPYITVNVDGGMIDNEPFSVTRSLLLNRTGETDKENKDYKFFRSCVLMVDPFPSEEAEKVFNFDTAFDLDTSIANIIKTMRSQLMFRPDDIEEAMDPNNASRFMIAPKRTTNGTAYHGSRAIASGCLGGFGGFLNKSFRMHDYFLGRRNCQHFLRQRFTIPLENVTGNTITADNISNPLFKAGYSNPKSIERFITKDGKALPIIPDMEYYTSQPHNKEEQYLPWPTINHNYLQNINPLLKQRIEKVMLSMAPKKDRFLLWLGSRVLLRKKIASAIIKWMHRDLNGHELLK